MNNYINLLQPLQKRIKDIKESFYTQKLISAGEENMIYGTFKKSFEIFSKESLRNGNRVNEIDFFQASIFELEQIEEAILMMEEKISLIEDTNIQFHSIFSIIHETKQEAKELISSFNKQVITKSKTTSKPKNVKSKLTYKWLIDASKLYDFKKLLISNGLIDNNLSFQEFKLIFSEVPTTELKKRLVWKNEIATQLIYLIDELQKAGVIEQNRKNFDFVKLYQCFEKNNGKKFEEKSKALKTKMNTYINSEYKILTSVIISEILK